jgi:hypothetical protein
MIYQENEDADYFGIYQSPAIDSSSKGTYSNDKLPKAFKKT